MIKKISQQTTNSQKLHQIDKGCLGKNPMAKMILKWYKMNAFSFRLGEKWYVCSQNIYELDIGGPTQYNKTNTRNKIHTDW